MWKKENDTHPSSNPSSTSNKSRNMSGGEPSVNPPPRPNKMSQLNSASHISNDMQFKGELRGSSDIVVSGKFEGTIDLPKNTVTVQQSGSTNATIKANTIIIYGNVDGNLYAIETAHVMESGTVRGDIKSPRVVLDRGCCFNGSIEMNNAKKSGEKEQQPPPRMRPTSSPPAITKKPDPAPSS